MSITELLSILRRRWPLVLALPALAALVSLAAGLAQPPRSAAAADLLVTRAEDRRFDTEDALAYDLPAIVSGEPFARAVSETLAAQGRQLGPEDVRAALSASNARRVVTIRAAHPDPAAAEAILSAAVGLVQREGLRLWGDPAATAERPGVNVVVLRGLPPQAGPVGGARDLVLDALARAAVALAAAVGAVLALHARESARSAGDQAGRGPSGER